MYDLRSYYNIILYILLLFYYEQLTIIKFAFCKSEKNLKQICFANKNIISIILYNSVL